MTSDNAAKAADDAMAEVLAETSAITPDDASAEAVSAAATDDDAPETPPGWAASPEPGVAGIIDAAVPAGLSPAVETEPLCDADTARDLVTQMWEGLEQFDNAFQEVIRLRAWEPLGYPTPREFVLAEFGPTDGEEGRVSRTHAFRLARLAMFLYGLTDRLGDEAAALELSERALRAIPGGRGGENDALLLDRIESRIGELGDDASQEASQQVVDEVLAQARREIAEQGSLSPSTGRTSGNAGFDDDQDPFDEDRLAALGLALDPLVPDPHETPGESSDDDTGADSDPREEVGASRAAMAAAYGTPLAASGKALEHTQQLASLTRGMQAVAGIEDLLPNLVDYASDAEILDLADLAKRTIKVAEELIAVAEAHGDEDLDPGADW